MKLESETYLASFSVGSQTDYRGRKLHFVYFLDCLVLGDYAIFTRMEVDI